MNNAKQPIIKHSELKKETQSKIIDVLLSKRIDALKAQSFAKCFDIDELRGTAPIVDNEEKDKRRRKFESLKNALERMDPECIEILEKVLTNHMWKNMQEDARIPELPKLPASTPYLKGALMDTINKALEETKRQQGIKKMAGGCRDVYRRHWAIAIIMDAWEFYIPLRITSTGHDLAKQPSPFHKVVALILSELGIGCHDYKDDILAVRNRPADYFNTTTSYFLGTKSY